METHDVYLQFDGFEKFGRIRCSLDEACLIFERYEDEACRRRESLRSCWITKVNSSQRVLGTQPKNWSPDNPVYENNTRFYG
jgi:hypothetical protein